MRDYKLSDMWADVLTSSPLPPFLTEKFVEVLSTQLDDYVELVTDKDEEMREYIYGTHSGLKYAVVTASYIDDPYVYFIIKDENYSLSHPVKELVNWYKSSGMYVSVQDMGDMIHRIHLFKQELKELFENAVRSRRSSGEDSDFNMVYPDVETLQRFYECGRKQRYDYPPEFPEVGKEVYLCPHCNRYHMGQPKTGEPIPESILLGRYKTAWSRYGDKRERFLNER